MATATASGTYGWAGTAVAVRPSHASASGTFGWAGTAVASSPKTATASGSFGWSLRRATAENGEYILDPPRWRVIVQEARSGQIVIPDLTVTNLVHQRALSAPADVQCDVDFHDDSVPSGFVFKPWGHLIHIERVMLGKRRIWISAIVQPSEIDEKTGLLHLKAKGFAYYPKQIPWLEDINWLANDAYDPIHAIWDHLQNDFPNGDLGVEVFPRKSGVVMLPGYAFDGDLLNLNFFATFIRAQDKLDCGDYIDALCRDIPIDYAERSEWNWNRTDIAKKIELGYPRLGLIQTNIVFVINENVLSAKPHIETQIDWVSDVGVSGWFPGMEFCVSDDTEIMTREGWKRYDEIGVGTVALTLDNETGLAEWQPVTAVNVFKGERWLYETEFRGHSSATTAEHRWPVAWGKPGQYYGTGPGRPRGSSTPERCGRRWSTTATLTKSENISCAAPVVDLPQTPKYDDALVELMAWYWTEGTYTYPGGKITIGQWGPHMARIKAAATRLFGPELPDRRRKGGIWDGAVWKSNTAGTVIRLGTAATDMLLEHIVDYATKAVSYDFIANLTQAQLELFIECSVWADADGDWDPSGCVFFGQKFEQGIDVLQFACQLAGRKTVKRVRKMNGAPWYTLSIYSPHRTTVKAYNLLQNMQRRWYKGVVWCPTTPNGSWCARRNGTVYFTGNSYELANADPDRLRRYLDETDGFIDSNERAAAWAHRRLARRQTPAYWEEITVDMNHPSAPFGSYDVGDTITVSGFMPWVGDIAQAHKIIAIGVDDTQNICKLTLKAEGAFNYDPIFFPDGVANLIANPGFDNNLSGWNASDGGWQHDSGQGANRLGSASIVADGADHYLMTQSFGLSPFQIFPMGVSVKCFGAVSSGADVQLFAQFYDDANTPTQAFMVGSVSPRGMLPWTRLGGHLIGIPPNTRCALGLHVGAGMTAGQVWFDDAEMVL